MMDTQLDGLQLSHLRIDFNPLDMPKGRFVTGGEAWLMCCEKGADPDLFGIGDMKGWAFVRNDMIRDFLALNKIEILPWDDWGLMAQSDDEAITSEASYMDQLARLTLSLDNSFLELREAYESDRRLKAAREWLP